MFKKIFGVLQQVGKALMLPVAILPAAGILLAFGNALQNPELVRRIPSLANSAVVLIAQVMEGSGGIVFDNLPLLFAVGVAVGLAGGEGVAGLAAIIGFLIMNKTMGIIIGITPEMVNGSQSYASVLGIPTLQTGVFGGIIVGILASYLYKKYYNIQLPQFLGFFAGKRFVPIITAVFSVLLGIIMTVIWPPIQGGLNAFSHSMIDQNLTLAAFVFGLIERSLIPFGLHHIWYAPFWFEFGSYTSKAGSIIHGDQHIFFSQLKDGVPFTAGTFMTGKFPFMMFGLPAAALAMYHEARPEKKKLVAGIFASAALTSFLTGITEPIEFTFLFIAPVLFGIHAVFAGLSFMIMHILNVKIGMTFSGGVIDYALFGILPNRTAWWLVIPVGLVFAVIYYFGFRFVIRKWDLKTPGREVDDEINDASGDEDTDSLPAKILRAFGGKENLSVLDACITRLRITVKDPTKVNKMELKRLGAAGVMEMGNNFQAIFGTQSDSLKEQMKAIINGQAPKAVEKKNIINVIPNNVETAEEEIEYIVAPLDGQVIDINEVPDPVFSGKMMGDGFAINPTGGTVVSPVKGKIATAFPTKHAIGLVSHSGLEVLIHVGIDTVNLQGKGFELLVKEGQEVEVGTPLLNIDLEYIRSHAKSTITPIVFTNLKENQRLQVNKGEVKASVTEVATVEKE
ncbi:glucose-specific PTS transporter subunit IIBC [Tepidibacillus marianensis]|uniref:glucose-specific PTS transporter subunit IIBC n=1 Tax=Tepidibacillus marianensis TaxID=3131995 RepID=UPI0030CFD9A7